MIGHGSKNQFRKISDLKYTLKTILLTIPEKSAFLYFGDSPNKEKPDIGYAFQYISEMRKDIDIFMIQIDKAKDWGIPSFVKHVYWHKDYNKSCLWGGLYNGKPCSNTKKLIQINEHIGVTRAFILGGGDITMDEYSLLKIHKIDYHYFPIERRYLSDGKTKITESHSMKERIGITYNKIK